MHLGRFVVLNSSVSYFSQIIASICRILVGRVLAGTVAPGDIIHGLSREGKELEKGLYQYASYLSSPQSQFVC